MAVTFTATKQESLLIRLIAKRAMEKIQVLTTAGATREFVAKDIEATHCNGCPLDLRKLLYCNDFSFAHDILGIRNALDRTTGKLTGTFDPRCALPAARRSRPAA